MSKKFKRDEKIHGKYEQLDIERIYKLEFEKFLLVSQKNVHFKMYDN
jgi:hypothetical protein